jgi:hypothetical protein
MVYVARRLPHVFRLGRFGGGLCSRPDHFRILTALVESSDDGTIRRLRLEDFHVSGERVIEKIWTIDSIETAGIRALNESKVAVESMWQGFGWPLKGGA